MLVCYFYLSERGGLHRFFLFVVVVVGGGADLLLFPVAFWQRGFHSQYLLLATQSLGRYQEERWLRRRDSPFPSSLLTIVLKVTGFKHT